MQRSLLLLPLLTFSIAMNAQKGQPTVLVREVSQPQLELLPSSPKVLFPKEAQRTHIQDVVVLNLTISPEGKVEKVDSIIGPDLLVTPTVKTVEQWTFKPYVVAGQATRVSSRFRFDFIFRGKVTINSGPGGATSLWNSGNPEQPLPLQWSDNDFPYQSPAPSNRMTLVINPPLLHQVAPVYPAAAQQKGVQGPVVFDAIVGKDGVVKNMVMVYGPHELAKAAKSAVAQWRYRPFLVNGEPANFETRIRVDFP